MPDLIFGLAQLKEEGQSTPVDIIGYCKRGPIAEDRSRWIELNYDPDDCTDIDITPIIELINAMVVSGVSADDVVTKLAGHFINEGEY